MAIPVGLMSPNARMDRRVGTDNPDQGYWQGDRFIFPRYKRPPMAPPVVPQGPMDSPMAPPMAMPPPQLPPMMGGDGGAGNAFGGREQTPDVNASVQGLMDNQPENVSPVSHADLPSLPSFNETVAPQASIAPADLAVSEVDPQGPSGKGKGVGKGTNSAAQATATAQAAVAAVDQAMAESKNKSADDTSMTDAVAAATQGMQAGVNFNDVDETGGVPGQSAPGQAMQSGMNAVASMNNTFNDFFGGLMSGLNDAVGGGGSASGGGVGANGNPGPGNDTSGTAAADAGGSWRKGGRTGNDGDRRSSEPRGKAHEDEFYFNPEMTSLMDRQVPGLLDRLDRFQKGLMAPRKQVRGLMG